MMNDLDPKEIETVEKLLFSNAMQQMAMINVLDKKGVMSKKELLDEIERLRKE